MMRLAKTSRSHCYACTAVIVLLLVVLYEPQVTPRRATLTPALPDARNFALGTNLAMAATPTPPSRGKQLLDELIRKANQEGKLIASRQSSVRPKVALKLVSAFKKRFGLNIEVSTVVGQPFRNIAIAIAETRAGAPATYDVVQADVGEHMTLIGGGGGQRLKNWKELLAEINPLVGSGKVKPEEISRGPLSGYAFQYMRNVKVIVYNPKLISKKDLPKTHKDLANPKYKGKFTQPPWTAHWAIAPAVFDNFDKQEWLQIVRQAGKNTGAVLYSTSGTPRVILGQFEFGLGHDAKAPQILARDPKASIANALFRDYNESNATFYGVRKRARHPAAATLWALWMTTPESQAIWQPGLPQAQPWGETRRDKEQRRFF